jgi:AcrR family transcriptional regulator
MRPQKVIDIDLLNGLMMVFRAKGYDGASLNELANSSGLKKASLYHRFPGGKKEIALAVIHYVDEWIDTNILKVLSDKEMEPNQKLDLVLTNINYIYSEGETACLLRALSSDSGLQLFGKELAASMNKWLEGFTLLGIERGFSQEKAGIYALEVLALVQGALVVANTFGNKDYFQIILEKIKAIYLE